MRNSTSVVLVAPNMLFGDGLSRIIRAGGFKVASCRPSVDEEALTRVDDGASTILIIDVDDVMRAAAQLELVRERHPTVKIAVIADDSKLLNAMTVLQERVHAYIRRSCTYQSFIKVLELIALGERFVPSVVLPHFTEASPTLSLSMAESAVPASEDAGPSSMAASAMAHCRLDMFSAQEARILGYIVDGHSNKMIARQMNIAEATVKVHVKAILRKLHVNNRTQAAIWAVNHRTAAASEVPTRQ